jgi:endoglucanase
LVALALNLSACGWFDQDWERWEAFHKHFVQDDGRVIDRTDGARSTSEGQAYGLFFALVANRPDVFASVLSWTTANLAQGDLLEHLPAWLWGERDDGSWGVVDPNPASDADLWIAYTLLEAARLWDVQQYEVVARAMLANVLEHEVVTTADGVSLLLPAPHGFRLEDGRVRLNPSYLPEFQFRYLDQRHPVGQWSTLLANHNKLLMAVSQGAGLAPDWMIFGPDGVEFSDGKPITGSYDAIRVYLWAGMTPGSEVLSALGGMSRLLADNNRPPERVDVLSGDVLSGGGPLGFSAALLPYLKALGDDTAIRAQQSLIEEADHGGLLGDVPAYYDHVLSLFGEGHANGWYSIDESGRLIPKWERSCWLIFGDC